MAEKDILSKLVQASALLHAIGQEQSFTKAAERLNIHQSAVSHRTKALEKSIGITLFERTTRRIQLTEAGKILCETATDSMDSWNEALNKLERTRSTNLIRLSLPSSLAMKWLVPALPSAQEMGLDISIEVKDEHINFQKNEAEAAIRFGHGPYPGLHSTHLSHSHLQAVASPSYIKKHSIEGSFLNDLTLSFLADKRGELDKTNFSWEYYFSALKQDFSQFKTKHIFDRADLMLQGTISGMGIGLGRSLLIENDISSGFLKPLGNPVFMKAAYWLVCSPSFAETERFERLLQWLRAKVKDTVL